MPTESSWNNTSLLAPTFSLFSLVEKTAIRLGNLNYRSYFTIQDKYDIFWSFKACKHLHNEWVVDQTQNFILRSDHFQTVIIIDYWLLYHLQGTKPSIGDPSRKIHLRKTTISNASLDFVVWKTSKLRHTPHRLNLQDLKNADILATRQIIVLQDVMVSCSKTYYLVKGGLFFSRCLSKNLSLKFLKVASDENLRILALAKYGYRQPFILVVNN